MKGLITTVLIFVTPLVFAQNAWEQLNDFPFEMRVHFSFATQDHGYVMTNATPNDTRMYKYISTTDSWEQLNSFPVIAYGYSAAVLGDVGYVLTDDNGTGEITIWRYDEPNDDWIVQTSAMTGFNPFCYSSTMFGVNDKLYVHVSQEVDNFRSYDPNTDTWENLTDAEAYGECYTIGFSVGDKGYLLFSAQEGGGGPLVKELWEFDSSNGIWTQRPNYPGYVDQTFDYPETIFVLNEMAYIGMTLLESTFHRYDPVTASWEAIQPCGYLGNRSAGFVIDNLAYVAGGDGSDGSGGSSYVDDVWRLDPERLSISEVGHETPEFYPNPAQDFVLVKGIASNYEFEIYSVQGKLVSKGRSTNRQFDVSYLETGLYLVAITSEENRSVAKLLKL